MRKHLCNNDPVRSRAGLEYSNIRSVGWHSIFNFEIWILTFFFFLNTWHPPRNGSQLVRLAEHLHQQQTVRQWKTFVLTYSMHIFHENLILWVRLPHIYIWNNELKRAKDATCERTLCYHKTECDACVFFVNCPEMRVKVLDQHAVALVVQTRCADVKPLWESEREKTRYSWITHAVFKWLI